MEATTSPDGRDVLLMGELFGDTLRKKDAEPAGERPFYVSAKSETIHRLKGRA